MNAGELHYYLFSKILVSKNSEICLGVKWKFVIFSFNISVQTERESYSYCASWELIQIKILYKLIK